MSFEVTKNFSQLMITVFLLFDYDIILNELSANLASESIKITKEDIYNIAYNTCERILMEIQTLGYQSVTLVSSQWLREFVDPTSLAINVGLHVNEKSLNEMLPCDLFLKPVVSVSQFISSTASYLFDGI